MTFEFQSQFVFGRTNARRGAGGVTETVIVCPSDFVSRRHCEVYYRDYAFWLKDLNVST